MGHKHDYWESIRRTLARPIGALVTGRRCVKETPDRFVGYVEMDEEEFEEHLHEMGFHRNPLSYWKVAVEKALGEEQGSWRKNHGRMQHHAVLYEHEDHPERTYIHAHWEVRWDVDPMAHLRGDDFSTSKGVNEMRRELDLASIAWHNDRTVQ